ncbi:hypothetical protein JNK13_04155 [bacterium]|nr:hypothetical protein [bacterium]
MNLTATKIIPQALAQHVLVVFILLALGLGYQSLSDLDLGWHLASGLWIIKHKQVPWADPFSISVTPWIDYSWLFDLLIASVYSLAGFKGLIAAQALLPAILVALVYQAFNRVAHSRFLVLLGLAILATYGVWSLRPQMLSLIFFVIALRYANSHSKHSLLILSILTIVAANIHVFWVFIPLLWLLKEEGSLKQRTLGSFSLVLCSLVNPYGYKLWEVIFNYATAHTNAYLMIHEFAPIYESSGLALCLFALFTLALAFTFRRLSSFRRVLLLIFFAGSFVRVKILPFYAILAALTLLGKLASEEVDRKELRVDTKGLSYLIGFKVLLTLNLFITIISTPLLSDRAQSILSLWGKVHTLSHSNVISHFNDSGWLILAEYLRSMPDDPLLRIVLDGRTLVTGEEKLQEAAELNADPRRILEFAEKYHVDYALFPRQTFVSKILLKNGWHLLLESDNYLVLSKDFGH